MKMFRWYLPVDDEDHEFPILQEPVMAGVTKYSGLGDELEFWAEEAPYGNCKTVLRVFGTGHDIPGEYKHVVSAPRDTRGLVWHVYKRTTP